jgi:ribose/xylose/arabinose/galactoside ABC-type transport system permease subunit
VAQPPIAQPVDYEPAPAPRARPTLRGVLEVVGPLIGLVGVIVLFAVLTPMVVGRQTFLGVDNFRLMLTQTAIVAVVALGMTYVIITAGIDLSVGSTIALACCVCAMLVRDSPDFGWDGKPLWLAVIAGILAGGAVGLFNGLLITQARLLPFIVTLATLAAVRGLAQGVTRQEGVYPKREDFEIVANAMTPNMPGTIGIPNAVWIVLAVSAVFAVVLRYTRFGRHVVAVGSNEHTARLCGVRNNGVKVVVYTIVGLCAGVAGVMWFGSLSMGDPATDNGRELQIIAAVVIGGASLSGGRGTILGTLAGAMIITVVENGCTKLGLQNWVQQIITGGIIIGAVLLDRVRRLGAAK